MGLTDVVAQWYRDWGGLVAVGVGRFAVRSLEMELRGQVVLGAALLDENHAPIVERF